MGGVLYTESGRRALVGDIRSAGEKHSKAMYTLIRDTGIQRWTGTRSEAYTNREQGRDVIASEFKDGMESQKSCGSDNSGCRDLGLAGVCQKMSHECYGM